MPSSSWELSTSISSGLMDGFPRRGRFSIPTIFVGSLMITLVALVGRCLSAWAPPSIYRSTPAQSAEALKPTLEILAGVPSVVLGFFALSFIAEHHASHMEAPRFSASAPPGSPSASSSSLSSHRSPRTPCVPCPSPCASVLRARRQALAHQLPGHIPSCLLGDRCCRDPRVCPGAGRDNGGRHRGRSVRWALLNVDITQWGHP